MTKNNLHAKRAFRSVLLVLLLSVVGLTNAFAQNHDFTSVAPNGQTLYYKITNSTTHTVKVTHPNSYYNSYSDYLNNYQNTPYGNGNNNNNYYTKPTGDLIIPYYVEYNGISYSVTAIDSYAFGTTRSSSYACTGLTSVVIPTSVQTIGTRAFAYCTDLTTVTIPTSVTSIDSEVFRYCSNLVTVNFNATNCSSVGTSTWDGCTNFTTLNLGNTVTRIPTQGFQGASKIISVNLPNSLTTIENYGFDGCSSLTTVTCGNASTLATIGDYAFQNCSNLANINLPNTVTTIGTYGFAGCARLKSTTATQLLPNALTSIGNYAFQNATTLAYIRIPSTLTSLGKYAFQGCTALNTVDYEATNCTYAGTQAEPPFFGCSALATVSVSDNVTRIPAYCFKDCTALSTLFWGNSVTVIGSYAFYGCQNISILIIPVSVETIGSFAFGNSYDLQLAQVWSPDTTPPSIGTEAVYPAGQTIYVPSASVSTYQSAANWSNYNIVGDDFNECHVTATADLASGGTVSGIGFYEIGDICTLTATVNNDYNFVGWKKDGQMVSDSETYRFIVTEDASFVAIFESCIGGGSMATSPSLPTHSYYNYSLTQQIYTANEIGSARAITSIAFYNAGTQRTRDLSFYMVHTEKTVFENSNDWIPVTEDDLVFSGEVTMSSNTWTVIRFDTIFTYNGTSNIAFVVDDNTGSFEGNMLCRVFGAAGNQTIHVYSDGTDYNPYNPAEYNGTLMSEKNQIMLSIPGIYTITLAANSETYGTVSGGGNYPSGSTASITAIPNSDYEFSNWTENGEIVSTEATYSFEVVSNRNLVANFIQRSYSIIATADPASGGTITGAGLYGQNTVCTLKAIPNSDFRFVNWTENGVVVSTDIEYSFTVESDRNLVAHFAEFTNYWVPEGDYFEDNMTLTCILQLDGVEQATTMLELGAFCGTQCRGSQRATYFAPTNRYIIQMTIFGENNDVISFRLYDHQQNQELPLTPPAAIAFTTNGYGSLFNPYVINFTSTVMISAETNPVGAGTITGTGEYVIGAEATLVANANEGYQFANWTLNGVVVSTSASYQFTVTDPANFVANFGYIHSQALNSGWNWWSTYIELNNNDGLSQLENSLDDAGIMIKSRANGYVEAYQYNGETNWYGTLSSINNEQMYKIRTNAACNAIVAGSFALPSSHPITIKNGWNWIGFPCDQNVSVDAAMSGFTPENNDVIKGRTGFTTYYSDENYNMWYGTLNTLEVGKGYMYRSNSATQKTLVFQTGRGEANVENITHENNFYQPADENFADNMTITAVMDIDGDELRSEDYELAAFVGDECRGSVRLMYVEPVDRYVAFLTVFGEPSETLYFRLTDGMQNELSMDRISFVADGMVGTLTEPMTLRFGTTQVDENGMAKVLVYPNPSNGVFSVQGQDIRKIEVFNAFGQAVVSEETSNDNLQIDLSRYANGCYMLRVVTDNGITNSQLIKK